MFLLACSTTITGKITSLQTLVPHKHSRTHLSKRILMTKKDSLTYIEPPPPKITRFQDAISSLEEVQSFLDWRGFSEEAITIASSMNKLTYFHCESLNSARQTTLDDYFHPTCIYLILYYSTHI